MVYNVKSMNADEFICHEEIVDTLAYADANKDNKELIADIMAKAKELKGLTHREASVLLACEDEEVIAEMYGLAEQIKKDFYGNRNIIANVCSGEMFGEAFACASTLSLPVSVYSHGCSEIILADCKKIIDVS